MGFSKIDSLLGKDGSKTVLEVSVTVQGGTTDTSRGQG